VSGGGNGTGVAGETDIDWNAVIAGGFLPDYTVMVMQPSIRRQGAVSSS
jgi:hypothetical protein